MTLVRLAIDGAAPDRPVSNGLRLEKRAREVLFQLGVRKACGHFDHRVQEGALPASIWACTSVIHWEANSIWLPSDTGFNPIRSKPLRVFFGN